MFRNYMFPFTNYRIDSFIPTNSLKIIEKSIPIFPPISALKITQDRVKEKKFFKDNNIPCAKTLILKKISDLKKIKKEVFL